MVLGQGGFGITYLAYDLTLRMRVAIKEYFPLGLVTRQDQTVTLSGGSSQPVFQKGVEAFYREAQLLVRFQSHPNIVHVNSFFRQNGTAYFVMEYVEGESLSDYLDRCGGRLSYDVTVKLLTPVLDALTDIHNAGILHRDIAPDNIYLTKNGNVKLLDFGAAKNELSLHTHSSAAILKQGYSPLEQYTAGSNQGPWTDVYAMGAVIYRCLTGILPPNAPDRLIGEPLLSFKEASVSAPAGAEATVNKALAVNYQDRWQHIEDFKNVLIDPSVRKTVKMRTREQAKTKKQKGRKTLPIPVLIVAAVILTGAGIISMILIPKERIYREGTALIAEGKYEEAILKLNEISAYRDSGQQIRNAKLMQAEIFLAFDDYDNAMTLFTELSGEDYAAERIAQRKEESEQLHSAEPEPTVPTAAAEIITEAAPEPEEQTAVPVVIPTEVQKASGRFQSQKPADGTSFVVGEPFDLTWTVENTGSTIWDPTYKLIYDSGTNFTADKVTEQYTGVTIWPQGAAGLTLHCTAPRASGTYFMKWHVVDENGNTVLSPLTIQIDVKVDVIYNWNYQVIVNYDINDLTTDLNTVRMGQTWYAHLLITGGKPGESIQISYKSHWPNGHDFFRTFEGSYKSGDVPFNGQTYTGLSGEVTVGFYDISGTKLLAGKTVRIEE